MQDERRLQENNVMSHVPFSQPAGGNQTQTEMRNSKRNGTKEVNNTLSLQTHYEKDNILYFYSVC